ncbi:MAG: creatininase family protein [Candidatus Latescibacterota bacterium]|nr:MAG: creatininase family protein [Candidatus Latescibacterota bacterium]
MKQSKHNGSPFKNSAGRDGAPALDRLRVIERLEVGPVKLERRRLTAPYSVTQNGRRDVTELVYRYEEDVFEPSSENDRDLANMIAAQVALNYGLLCDEIVFRGGYDTADRKFLAEMAENTAREIYVKKFLEPNPFLVPALRNLSVTKKKSYLNASLTFADSTGLKTSLPWSPTESKPDRIAILSSGGKDSLLSFGLLREMGYETHPVFVNESGRHWFTALNAFRYFKADVPNTSRVWVNSDRVFAWMLRHLPFVRQDFATVRSDEYPIRLWTVAVFLFGALPILRKRGVGRLVVGDEYDTTARLTHKGITHYNGLYDQSRYFDNALSRYYSRKRWAMSQFSILRPLSELLIEKVLVKRYPELFKHQMSCHAAHTAGSRVRPCGKCEKCRRIVGMVLANDGAPVVCGYDHSQVDECLAALAVKPTHQEQAGAEHLVWMLRQNGLLDDTDRVTAPSREHPEIMKLRFDQERSPMEGIPQELRLPLYRILLQHADGAVRRKGKMWTEIDLPTDAALHQPYVFERSKPGTGRSMDRDTPDDGCLLGEMTWPVAKKRFKEVDVALLPVGSIEQHGPHLPLDTDAFDAYYLAMAVARKCSDPKPVVLPLVPYGVSYHHEEFSGTISVGNETLSRLVYEIGMSAAKNGVTKLVIINGHGGNDPALNFAAQMINRDARIFVCVDSGETSDVDIYSMIETPNDVHAGEIETSTSLATRPELVNMKEAEKLVPQFSSRYLDFTSKRGISWYAFTKRISDSGVMGDPTRASAEKGEKMWGVMIRHLVAFVEDLKQLTLDEIFQRRY